MSLFTDPGHSRRTLGSRRKGSRHLDAVERLKDWTRDRFRLSGRATVLVAERECVLPGFPPLKTVVTFWSADGAPHHFLCFKPAGKIVEADLPPAWLKDALADSGPGTSTPT